MTRRDGLILAALTLLAVALRLPNATDALFGDELSTLFIVSGHGPRAVLDLVDSPQEQTPPLIFLLAWVTAHLGSDSMWLRLPSMLAGAATIPLLYGLGTRIADRRAGLLAAAFAALHPFLLFYATEARAYALAALLDLLSTYALVRALQGGARRWWAVYALAACLAMYTHYTAGFVLVAQALWALWTHRDRWKPIVAASAAAAVAWAPWLPVYLSTSDSPGARVIDAVHPFSATVVRTDVSAALMASPFLPLSRIPGTPFWVLIVAGTLVAVGGGLRWRSRRPPGSGWLGLLVVCTLAAPVLGALASVVGPSVFLPRNLITAVPYACLAVAVLALAGDRRVAVVGAAAVAVGLGAGAVASQGRAERRPNVDAAVRDVQAAGGPGTPIVITRFPYVEPGVLQRFEAALADHGLQRRYPVLRLGLPTAAADRRRRDGGPGQFSPIPDTDPAAIAAQALRAARGGPIVVVDSGLYGLTRAAAKAGQPVPGGSANPLPPFFGGLPGYRVVRVQRHAGLVTTDVLTLRRGG